MPTLTAYRLLGGRPHLKIIPAPADRIWMEFTGSAAGRGWANRCLPLRVANQAGWLILNDRDLEVTWNGKPYREGLQVRYRDGAAKGMASSMFGYGIVTWEIPYLFRTPSGCNLLARGPANLPKDGAYALEGLVETDWAVASFTMNWKITRPGRTVKFDKDEPICMIVPQARGELEAFEPEIRNLQSEPELERAYQQWLESRRAAQERRDRGEGDPNEWQGDYMRGLTPAGAAAPQHQTKLQLRPFVEREGPLPFEPATTPAAAVRASMWERARRLFTVR